jgi:hypothetical protein
VAVATSAHLNKAASSQLVALVLILHWLERHERITELVDVAATYSHDFRGFDRGVHRYLADVIGDDEAFAALPTPDPADLTTDRIASLIGDLITEISDIIAHRAPGRWQKPPRKPAERTQQRNSSVALSTRQRARQN